MTNLSTLRNAIQQFDTNLFTPYAVGFDRTFDRLFDYATHQATSTGFPPYNIVKDGDYNYTIEMALAGYSKKDIEVEVAEGVLTVKSIKDVTDGDDSKLSCKLSICNTTINFTIVTIGNVFDRFYSEYTFGYFHFDILFRIPSECHFNSIVIVTILYDIVWGETC